MLQTVCGRGLAAFLYQAGWFFATGALAVVLLAWLAHRSRLGRIRAEALAVFAERSRMARELHDSLLQDMAAAALEIENVRERLPPSLPETRRLQEVERTLASSLEATRRLVWNLRGQSSAVSDLGLALGRLAQRLEGEGIRCAVRVEGTSWPLEPAAKGALFLIAQEAMTNAIKHARPSRIDVHLAYQRAEIVLAIHDDGAGFSPTKVEGPGDGHFGLTGMRERAERLGASLTIESEPGHGTTVVLILGGGNRGMAHG